MACYPLKSDEKDAIRKVYETDGTIAAVKKRIEIEKAHSNTKIAEGLTTDDLLDDFIVDNAPDPDDFEKRNIQPVAQMQKILDDSDVDDFEVFPCGQSGVVLWNRRLMRREKVFYDVCHLDETGTMIRVLDERAGVCYINENAISFAQRIKELNRSN